MVDSKTPVLLTITLPTNASIADSPAIVVPAGGEYEVVEVTEVHGTAGTDAGAVTVDVKKASSGTAISGGTSVLASTFNAKSTINTPVSKTAGNGGLSSSLATRTVTSGQMLGLDLTGVLTALAGLSVTISLKLRRPPNNR